MVVVGAAEDDGSPILAGELTETPAKLPKRFDALALVPPGAAGVEVCAEEKAGRVKVTPDVLGGGLMLFPPSTNGLDDGAED